MDCWRGGSLAISSEAVAKSSIKSATSLGLTLSGLFFIASAAQVGLEKYVANRMSASCPPGRRCVSIKFLVAREVRSIKTEWWAKVSHSSF